MSQNDRIPPAIVQLAFSRSNPFWGVPMSVLGHMVDDPTYKDSLRADVVVYLEATYEVKKEMECNCIPMSLRRIEKKLNDIIGEDDGTWSVGSSDSERSGDDEEYVPPLTRQGACRELTYEPTQCVESPEWPGYDDEE